MSVLRSNRPIRLAFPLIGRGHWTGGLVYLKNTLGMIASRLSREIEPCVFLSPQEAEAHGRELEPLCGGRLIVDPAIAGSGRGASLARAIATGRDGKLESILKASSIDVAFEVASFYGARFGLPVIAWLPDFQHRHMPQMFGRANWWRRDLGFRAQTASGRTLMVSSKCARDDMERFYPASRGRVHVVRFAIDLDIARHMGRGPELRALYGLPERFFYLPNQIWRHKNHAAIVAALATLASRGELIRVPPVIVSGLNKDPRNPGHFDALMAQARAAGVGDHFRYLGLIPYDHVLGLAGACEAVINPSVFEGWSTPIEEAKALGASLLLSDIPLHREQAPDARFFDPASPDAAAAVLLGAASAPLSQRAALPELMSAQDARLSAHAAALLETVRAASREAAP